MMNLMHWRLLVAVVDNGSITAAAEHVGMTQSAASQAMATMEKALGAQLFVRHNRQTQPTALGERVIEQARVMLDALQAIRSSVKAARPLTQGSLRLAGFPVVLATLLAPLLQRFKQRYPGIEVITLEVSDDEVQSLLDADLVDLGMVLNPPPEQRSVVLGRDSWMAVLPQDHPLQEDSLSLQALVAQPFVLVTGGCALNARSLAEAAGLTLADVQVTVREWNSAFSLVRQGVGVTLAPQMTLQAQGEGLRVVPLSAPIEREFALVCAPHRPPSAAVDAFLQMLAPLQPYVPDRAALIKPPLECL